MDIFLILISLIVALSLNEGHAEKEKPILGRCVDCANNVKNWKDVAYRDPARACINDGHGLACAEDGHHWICALTDDLKKGQCERSYTYELWCNMADRTDTLCDGREEYVVEGGDGRVEVDGKFVGPDGKYNSWDEKVLVIDMSDHVMKG